MSYLRRGGDSSKFPSGPISDFRVMGEPFFLSRPARTHRKSAYKPLITCQALVQKHNTFRRDFILANILGMVAAAHLDNYHNLAKLAFDGYVPQPDDVIA